MTRVLVLSDSAVVRVGLEAMLRDDGRFDPVQSDFPTSELTRFSSLRSSAQADVVLAEVKDKRLLTLAPRTDDSHFLPSVLMVDDLSRSELVRALHIGARAILPRDADPAEILAAIEAVSVGLAAFASHDLDLLIHSSNRTEHEDEIVVEALSAREIEVLAAMADGLPNKNIADRLGISEHTVKFHVSSILSKLGASSRTQAVTRGLKDGLLVI